MNANVKKILVLATLSVTALLALSIAVTDRGREGTFRTEQDLPTVSALGRPPEPATFTTIALPILQNKVISQKQATSVATLTDPYTVTMSPMGNVRFEHVPLRVVTLDANYNDMLVALGEGSKLVATGYRGNFYDGFYEKLGVKANFDPNHLTFLSSGAGGTFDKELFYQLHADVHHIDPVQLATTRGWSQSDVEEIARNVGPFFANRYSRDNSYGGKEPYQYYTLWELSAKVGEVYQRPEIIAKLTAV